MLLYSISLLAEMARANLLPFILPLLVASVYCQTPVIGGACKIGTADVQIGGKQTQFFLKCESTSDSADGEGVWVVKSRAAAAAVPLENVSPQQHPKRLNSPNICEQDNNSRESASCSVSATCLQATQEYPDSYLQCDQTAHRWVRKSCQDGFIFNFEQQTCVVPKRTSSTHRQQPISGLVCTFSSCSNSNPCNQGTCNNGYCCSSSSNNNNAIIVQAPQQSNCVGCGAAAAPQIITIPSSSCPGGGYSVGQCSSGYCSSGYSCVQGNCCPSYNPQPQVQVFQCSGGGQPVGACIQNSCSTGYTCQQGSCCPAISTANPFVCADGTQAAGGCVNGQCGAGYSCTNGLCCAGTSSTVRCLDGSEAVGACIPSCTGQNCGQVSVSYYCGTGYTCTTGNICCAINSCPNGGDVLGPTVNGLCPTGYTVQGTLCCSNVLCADGTASQPAVNGLCPTGFVLEGAACCASNVLSTVECATLDVSIGPCVNGGCGANIGYLCDAAQVNCCPAVDYLTAANQLGPSVGGLCPLGYAVVYIPGVNVVDGTNLGTCVTLQSIPGICAESVQPGPCINGGCVGGYFCFTAADVCCPSTTFRKLRPGMIRSNNIRPNYGRPLESYMPQMKLNDSPVEGEKNELKVV